MRAAGCLEHKICTGCVIFYHLDCQTGEDADDTSRQVQSRASRWVALYLPQQVRKRVAYQPDRGAAAVPVTDIRRED